MMNEGVVVNCFQILTTFAVANNGLAQYLSSKEL